MSNYDPTDTASQERAQADAQRRREFAKDSEEADFKWLMSSKRGRRIVWRLLERAGLFHPSFNTNSMAMAYHEGKKAEGNYAFALIQSLCPELYPQMVKEQKHDRPNTDD